MAIKMVNEPKEFVEACTKADVKPTKRQLKKWKNKKGKAYMNGR